MQGGKIFIIDLCYEVKNIYHCIYLLVDCTFQSEEGIAHELGSLETCLTISTIRETSPQVFFPPLNKSIDEKSFSHTAHSHSSDADTGTAAEQSEVTGTAKTETSLPEHTDEDTSQDDEKVELLASSQSIETATTTYDDHVARLLDVLQSAVQCRVSRAPPVTQREVVTQTQLHRTPALESVTVSKEGVDIQNKSGEENKLCCAQKALEDGASGGTVMRGSARVAILFSGGVDSAVLAALADRLGRHSFLTAYITVFLSCIDYLL